MSQKCLSHRESFNLIPDALSDTSIVFRLFITETVHLQVHGVANHSFTGHITLGLFSFPGRFWLKLRHKPEPDLELKSDSSGLIYLLLTKVSGFSSTEMTTLETGMVLRVANVRFTVLFSIWKRVPVSQVCTSRQWYWPAHVLYCSWV